MTIAEPAVLSVQVGRVAPLGPDLVPSGFVKRPVDGPVRVGTLGLAGDQQADLQVHGGPEKAVYAYAGEIIRSGRRSSPSTRHGCRRAPSART